MMTHLETLTEFESAIAMIKDEDTPSNDLTGIMYSRILDTENTRKVDVINHPNATENILTAVWDSFKSLGEREATYANTHHLIFSKIVKALMEHKLTSERVRSEILNNYTRFVEFRTVTPDNDVLEALVRSLDFDESRYSEPRQMWVDLAGNQNLSTDDISYLIQAFHTSGLKANTTLTFYQLIIVHPNVPASFMCKVALGRVKRVSDKVQRQALANPVVAASTIKQRWLSVKKRDTPFNNEEAFGFVLNPNTPLYILDDIASRSEFGYRHQLVANNTITSAQAKKMLASPHWATSWQNFSASSYLLVERKKLVSLEDFYLIYKDMKDTRIAGYFERFMAMCHSATQSPFYGKLGECLAKHSDLDIDFETIPDSWLPKLLGWEE